MDPLESNIYKVISGFGSSGMSEIRLQEILATYGYKKRISRYRICSAIRNLVLLGLIKSQNTVSGWDYLTAKSPAEIAQWKLEHRKNDNV